VAGSGRQTGFVGNVVGSNVILGGDNKAYALSGAGRDSDGSAVFGTLITEMSEVPDGIVIPVFGNYFIGRPRYPYGQRLTPGGGFSHTLM